MLPRPPSSTRTDTLFPSPPLCRSAHGGAGVDTIHGDAGDDLLHGGAGDDVLYGDDGFDRLFGGAGADSFMFESASAFNDADVISDFRDRKSTRLNSSH